MADKNAKKEQGSKPVQIEIVPKDEDNVPRQYANYAKVIHSPFDFTITFCDAPALEEGRLRELDGKYSVEAPIVARICCSHSLIPKLIEVLQKQQKAYLKIKAMEAELKTKG